MAEPAQDHRPKSAEASTADRILDLALFAPLGLALTVGELVPELARKGRSKWEPQIGLARTVGRMAVHQGARQLGEAMPFKGGFRLVGWPGRKSPPSEEATVVGAREANVDEATSAAPRAPRSSSSTAKAARPAPSGASTGRATPARSKLKLSVVKSAPDPRPAGGRAPGAATAGNLAIPSYDALSASQVVQRLAGLSRDEVRAVRAYEASTRGRRTILSKADQLLV